MLAEEMCEIYLVSTAWVIENRIGFKSGKTLATIVRPTRWAPRSWSKAFQ